jgi:hypothetical protein
MNIVKFCEPAVTLEGNRPLIEGVGLTIVVEELPQLVSNARDSTATEPQNHERTRIKPTLQSISELYR